MEAYEQELDRLQSLPCTVSIMREIASVHQATVNHWLYLHGITPPFVRPPSSDLPSLSQLALQEPTPDYNLLILTNTLAGYIRGELRPEQLPELLSTIHEVRERFIRNGCSVSPTLFTTYLSSLRYLEYAVVGLYALPNYRQLVHDYLVRVAEVLLTELQEDTWQQLERGALLLYEPLDSLLLT